MGDISTILTNAMSPDQAVRNYAEQQLEAASGTNYEALVMALCGELVTEGKPQIVRQAAGLYLKNLFTAQSDAIYEAKLGKWEACNPQIREQIRLGILQTLQSADPAASRVAAQVTAAIGAYELPKGSWTMLLQALFANMSSPATTEGTKIASLETLGYMCQEIEEELDKTIVDQILSSIINGMGAEHPSGIRKAAVEALQNSIVFTSANFAVDAERNAIMEAVCSTARCTDPKVRELSHSCLGSIAEEYYIYLMPYMAVLFPLTSEAISTDSPEAAKMALEFWATIFAREYELGDSEQNLQLANKAKDPLLPLILTSLLRASDEDDEEEWTLSAAADLCLQNLVDAVDIQIIPPIIAFASQHIEGNWQSKRAALFCMTSIMGLDRQSLSPYILPIMPFLLKYLQDPQTQVRSEAAYTLSEILSYHTDLLPEEGIQQVLLALHASIDDQEASVAKNSVGGLMRFAQYVLDNSEDDPDDQATNRLSAYASGLLQKLLLTAEKPGFGAKMEAYEAASLVVEACAQDQYPLLVHCLGEANTRLDRTFSGAMTDSDRQSDICAVINVCVRKLPWVQLAPISDATMMLLLKVLSSSGAAAKEEALMAVGCVADKAGENFDRYFQAFIEHILAGLRNVDESSNCLQAVCALSAIVKAMGPKIMANGAAALDSWMAELLSILSSESADRCLKPAVIAAFCDVALNTRGDFERYLVPVIGVLQKAQEVDVNDADDEDAIEAFESIQSSVLDAYTGIVAALQDGNKLLLLSPHVQNIFQFIAKATLRADVSEEILLGAIGLVGDLAQAGGPAMLPIVSDPQILSVVQQGMHKQDNLKLAETAKYTLGIIESLRRAK